MQHNWIKKLNLEKHIEGGYFGLFYQSTDKVVTIDDRYKINSPSEFPSIRNAGTSIYFLLENNDFSAWHILKSDEIWHYYDGDSAVLIHTINKNGEYDIKLLGNPKLNADASFQVVIKSETWFAAELENKASFALMGCTVAPGFEYKDFMLADRNKLSDKYPNHADVIKRLTHEKFTVDLGK